LDRGRLIMFCVLKKINKTQKLSNNVFVGVVFEAFEPRHCQNRTQRKKLCRFAPEK